MSRAFPIAGVYIITNRSNGRIYIGESFDLQSRFSRYREIESKYARGKKKLSKYTPIEQAIINEGYDNFRIDTIVDKFDDPKLEDIKYRRTVEAYYIDKYHCTDDYYGYNTNSRNSASRTQNNVKRMGRPHTPGTKIYKSDPILVYNMDDQSVMMFLGKKSFGEYLGDINHTQPVDRAIISRCARFGRKYKNYYIFPLDPDKRHEAIVKSIKSKLEPNVFDAKNGYKKLYNYLSAMGAIDDWCDEWGYDTKYRSEYMSLIPEKKLKKMHLEYDLNNIKDKDHGPSLLLSATQEDVDKYFNNLANRNN